jgi:uridine phosphorylase
VNAGVAQLVERNLAKVEVESSSLFSRSRLKVEAVSSFHFDSRRIRADAKYRHASVEFSNKFYAGVAQLVERNLAKVEVESSSLFSRSRLKGKLLIASLFILRKSYYAIF